MSALATAPRDASTTVDPANDASAPRAGIRLTRREKSDARGEAPRASDDDDLLDDSPACTGGEDVELRTASVVAGQTRRIRVSIRNCSAGPLAIFFHRTLVPLDVDAFDRAGRALVRRSSTANEKFDPTVRCSFARTLAAGQERLLEDVHVEETPFGVAIRSGALEIDGPAARIDVSLPSLVQRCVGERSGPTRLPAATWGGRAVAPPVALPERALKSTPLSPPGSCVCPDLTWANGPALAAWEETKLERSCRFSSQSHAGPKGAGGDCVATLECEGDGGARALDTLVADPIVLLALGGNNDFGARAIGARDGAIQRLRVGGNTLSAPGCFDRRSPECQRVPRAVLDLLDLAHAVTPSPIDGGPRAALALRDKRCK